MKDKLYQEILKLNQPFTFTIPKESIGFRLILLSDIAIPWNLLLYTDENKLVGQAMSFNVEKELWIGPELLYTSPYCLPLKEERNFSLYNLPMADYPENFPEMRVEVISYETRDAWIKDFPLSLLQSRQEAPLEYWIDENQHSSELTFFEMKKIPAKHQRGTAKTWFAGDLHTHTIYSDGKCNPKENIETAKEHKLDFFAATDHTVFPLAWPREEEILILPSTEITTGSGHWNLHFSMRSPFDGMGLFQEEDLLSLLTYAGAIGHLCINHPFMNPWEMKLHDFPLSLASSMEILNDPTFETAGYAAEKALKAWSLLWNWGHDLVGVGGSDAHLGINESYAGKEEPSRLGDPITWIRADGLSAKGLRDGLDRKEVAISRCGRPHLSLTDHEVNGLFAGSSAIGKHLHLPEVELSFELLDPPDKELYHEWILDGEVIEKKEGTKSTKRFRQEEGHWIRVDVRLETGELYATLNPVRIRDSDKKGETWGDIQQELTPEIKGVLFDKDGTLLQFTDLWIESTKAYLDTLDLSEQNRRNCELALGIEESQVRENSPLASGTLDQIIQCITPFTRKRKASKKALAKTYSSFLKRHPEKVKTTGDLASLFRHLREKNLKLGVLTSDDENLAREAFELVHLSEEFDFLGGGDRYQAKPSPEGIYAACQQLGLKPEEILFVGDSLADVRLGKYVGKVLGIISEVSSLQTLAPWADDVIYQIEDVALHV